MARRGHRARHRAHHHAAARRRRHRIHHHHHRRAHHSRGTIGVSINTSNGVNRGFLWLYLCIFGIFIGISMSIIGFTMEILLMQIIGVTLVVLSVLLTVFCIKKLNESSGPVPITAGPTGTSPATGYIDPELGGGTTIVGYPSGQTVATFSYNDGGANQTFYANNGQQYPTNTEPYNNQFGTPGRYSQYTTDVSSGPTVAWDPGAATTHPQANSDAATAPPYVPPLNNDNDQENNDVPPPSYESVVGNTS